MLKSQGQEFQKQLARLEEAEFLAVLLAVLLSLPCRELMLLKLKRPQEYLSF
jgi:predicted secreted protein